MSELDPSRLSSARRVPKLEDYLPEELESVLVDRLISRAQKKVLAVVTVVLGLLGLFGYAQVTDVRKRLDERVARLDSAIDKLEARSQHAQKLNDSIHQVVSDQAGEIRGQRQAFASMVDSYSNTFASNMRSVGETLGRNEVELRGSRERLAEFGQTIERTKALHVFTNDTLRERVRTLEASSRVASSDISNVRDEIAASGVQIIGARERSRLYGTPFDVYFSRVAGNRVREFILSSAGGGTIETKSELLKDQTIRIPYEGSEYLITVVNVLDIPGGLLSLPGRSRTDAASFHVKKLSIE